ncbi:related to positive activator of transcription [Fusarium fujikuroi IMI 58289]|uniref:Related to positive activator of transcription n=1 Tax=Gibberella fujikuroi (strain CBS 195.34 / IMI 58289 / NRRL A-6831) TaxID=1279085 RepID=S0DUH5_GIBF5|nr:related to positive activator of transcription [Fusarium fujikuroi IMI 58289]KLP08658.1 positive activator of transcription [Fusarium fujikuroi]CCT64208.1 related to positive activator of transcription [Fusarium fujikuroi IMI 58289]SCO37747.1 related to positive activator of transcription [Fusarium fujikuroi]
MSSIVRSEVEQMDNEINVRSTRARARKREKISNACIACRNSKTRCSGRHPCERCIRRNETCVFEEKEKKVAVSVDYLDQLHARIESLEAQSRSVQGLNSTTEALSSGSMQLNARYPSINPPQSPLGETRTPSRSESSSLTNTLVTSEPQIKVHRYGHAGASAVFYLEETDMLTALAYLGHSSTLSFSRNVRNLLQRSSPIADPGSVSMERQDISYTRTLPPIALDLSGIALPKLSYAEYLTNTVIVHIGSLYSIFDADVFLQRLRRFYDDRDKDLEIDASLWHIQMLLILAFGKSIQSREHSEMGPSGMTYFTLAIEAMPDIRRLYEDPLLSIEVLCLAALFMHATDLLQEAYVTIGQALRISVTKVLNKRFPEALRSSNFEYQRRLWWTVYCIDRKCAAMLGSPSVMRDDDISIPFPEIKPGDESQNAFAIHAILSSHLGKILDAIYGVHDHQRSFLLEVKSILSRIAETYVILRQHLPLDVQQPSQPVSREPVLFSLLKPLLASNAPIPDGRHSSSPFESMLKMCIESAVQILNIMSILKQQMMCDIFLPYDIDALFSAAFALILIDIIRPANELLWDLPQVMNLLGEFVSRRVAPAQAYRSDLVQILELHTKLRGNNCRQHQDTGTMFNMSLVPGLDEYAITQPGQLGISPDPLWANIRDGNVAGDPAHPNTILSVIDDLNVEGFDISDTDMLDNAWMWDMDDMSTNI